ncbi:conserved hypothetical protein [Beggiatoa sp. SS]|nr:conserved hypothetical protein [Beggiatoa sp. SS]
MRFFDNLLTYSDNLREALRDALDRYKEVIYQWPAENWVETEEVPNPADSLRLGQFSHHAYPTVNQAINEEDPFVTAAMSLTKTKLQTAFRLDANAAAIYAWPEEANAVRIADKIRHLRQREPEPFSPKIVSFMRNAKLLHAFMADLAENRITSQAQEIILNREEQTFKIGPTAPTLSGIALFEDVVRQVVALGFH